MNQANTICLISIVGFIGYMGYHTTWLHEMGGIGPIVITMGLTLCAYMLGRGWND